MAAGLIEVLSEALSDRSEVRTRGQSLMAGEKMFAYANGGDMVIKLPADEVEGLLRRKAFSPHVVGTKVMAEWVVVSRPQPAAYLKDLTLLRKAIEFVGQS